MNINQIFSIFYNFNSAFCCTAIIRSSHNQLCYLPLMLFSVTWLSAGSTLGLACLYMVCTNRKQHLSESYPAFLFTASTVILGSLKAAWSSSSFLSIPFEAILWSSFHYLLNWIRNWNKGSAWFFNSISSILFCLARHRFLLLVAFVPLLRHSIPCVCNPNTLFSTCTFVLS